MAPKVRVTLKDVAEKCGYSVNTVSRALRGDSRLPRETLERIQSAALEVGYIRNSLASSLRSGRTHVIAIIIEDLQNQHYSALLNRLSLCLSQRGYRVMILPNRHDASPFPSGAELSLPVAYAISHGVDGVFFFPDKSDGADARALLKNHIPLVLIDREIDGMDLDVVRVDDYQGGCLAADLLLSHGHRSIAYLAGPLQNGSQHLRQQGFLDTLRKKGLREAEVAILSHGDFFPALAEGTLAERFLSLPCTAVFSFNDQLAYYLQNSLQNASVPIPERISILGFDFIRSSFPYMAPLSTIGIAKDQELAALAVDRMLEKIEHPDSPAQKIILPVEYVDGGTLGRA